MSRPESPAGRRVHMNVRFSEAEAALVDAARGARERGAWLRGVALAALGIPESLNAGGIEIPVVVSGRQPPGTVTAVSAGKDADGRLKVSAANAVNVSAGGPAAKPRRDPKNCKHENMKLHRGWCPDCETMAVKK